MSTAETPGIALADWQEDYWDSLVWSLQQGNCILLLGDEAPGASRDLKKKLLDEVLAKGLQNTAGLDFRQVARLYETKNGRNELNRKVSQFYLGRPNEEAEVHRQLAALPFSLTITSCHDTFLEKAFSSHPEKRLQVSHYNLRGGEQEVGSFGPSNPLVYHLYGSVKEAASLVLTENDLLDFLVKVTTANPRLPDSICRELQKSEKTFLFLGFGIKRWYLRVLLHVLKLLSSGNRSFALEDFEASNMMELNQAAFFYRNGTRIEIFNGDVAHFVAELTKRWKASGGAADVSAATTDSPALPPPPARDLGTIGVFISYARENQSQATRIYEGLKLAGLDPWMDKDLGGGSDWNPAIESKIQEKDYFVVAVSKALNDKRFSYVNKEIKLALDRQQYAQPDIIYIIPAGIEDDAPILPALSHLNLEVIREEADIARLASTIKRDFQRRQRRSNER